MHLRVCICCRSHVAPKKAEGLYLSIPKFSNFCFYLLILGLFAYPGVSVVVTSGPDSLEINYVDEILKKAGIVDKQVLNLAGKTSLLGLAALIKGSQFFIGLDSVASHIAASVDKESITLFGPSNPVNWKPWSDKSQIIAKQDLKNIEVSDVMSLIEEVILSFVL